MEMGIVATMHSTRGREMAHIMTKEPATVTRAVRICTTSVAREVETTSIS